MAGYSPITLGRSLAQSRKTVSWVVLIELLDESHVIAAAEVLLGRGEQAPRDHEDYTDDLHHGRRVPGDNHCGRRVDPSIMAAQVAPEQKVRGDELNRYRSGREPCQRKPKPHRLFSIAKLRGGCAQCPFRTNDLDLLLRLLRRSGPHVRVTEAIQHLESLLLLQSLTVVLLPAGSVSSSVMRDRDCAGGRASLARRPQLSRQARLTHIVSEVLSHRERWRQ